MRYDDPNRVGHGANLREHEKYLGNDATGDAGKDGYTVLERRPRVRFVREPMEPARADRIEESYRSFPGLDSDNDLD